MRFFREIFKAGRRSIWLLLRYVGFITASLFGPIILFPFFGLAKLFGRPLFGFVFFVYPGSINQIKVCVPLWYRNIRPGLSIISVVTKGECGERGLVMAIPWTLEEMEGKNNFLEETVKELEILAKFIGAKTVALGGRAVTVLFRRGYDFRPPLITGDKGAVYTVLFSIEQALKLVNSKNQKIEIGILGYGFLGSRLGAFLGDYWKNDIVALDPRFTQSQNQGKIRLTSNPSEIVNCDLIVVLTPKGEQIEDEIQYFKSNAIVVDDTYPSLSKKAISGIEKRGGRVIKAGAWLKGVKFWPKLPKWEANRIPGCCVEAMVISMFGGVGDKTQKEFNNLANQVGFEAFI